MKPSINDMTADELREEVRRSREQLPMFQTVVESLVARVNEREAALKKSEQHASENLAGWKDANARRQKAEDAAVLIDTDPASSTFGEIRRQGKAIGVTKDRLDRLLDAAEDANANDVEQLQRDLAAANARCEKAEQEARDWKSAHDNALALCDDLGNKLAATTEANNQLKSAVDEANARCDSLCSQFVPVPEWVKLPWRVGPTSFQIMDANSVYSATANSAQVAAHIVACVNAMGAKPGDRPVTRTEAREIALDHMATMEARHIGPCDALASEIAEKHGMELTGEYREPKRGEKYLCQNKGLIGYLDTFEYDGETNGTPRYLVRPKAKEDKK